MTEQDRAAIAFRYRRFADEEARGRSPLYQALAHGVAMNRDALAFLGTLPQDKQQPNLLFAAVRFLHGTPADWPGFLATLTANAGAVRSVMLQRATQTNEPARCATLLPVLARLPQPLALIEVGASAGLCLLPDLYGYDYGNGSSPLGQPGASPVFACAANAATPLPNALPRVAWRAGIDLHPVDAADPMETAWLEALVWPEQTERLARLRAALATAGAHRVRIRAGDLLGEDLPRLCREAPRNATCVVFHSAVLSYLADPLARAAFAKRAMSLCRYWLANESPRVFPDIAGRIEASQARHARSPGWFLLSANARPLAWTDPHGAAIDWFAKSTWLADI